MTLFEDAVATGTAAASTWLDEQVAAQITSATATLNTQLDEAIDARDAAQAQVTRLAIELDVAVSDKIAAQAQLATALSERDAARDQTANVTVQLVLAQSEVARLTQALADCQAGQQPPPDPAVLPYWGAPVWRDEFDGATLDPAKWNARNATYNSNERSYLLASQVSVGGGALHIKANRRATPFRGSDGVDRWYNSGYIDTIGKESRKGGRWEMRAKLPLTPNVSRGSWPAFWLRPDNGATGGEVDIMEGYGTPDARVPPMSDANWDLRGRTEGTLHFDQSASNRVHAWTPVVPDIDTGWHVWAVEWRTDSIKFLFDGAVYLTYNRSTDPPKFDGAFGTSAKFHTRLNLQIGSGYWGYYDPAHPQETATELDYVVDYVRVWALPA